MTDEGRRGETIEVEPGIYAYIQPDGTWYINNTAFLVGRNGVVSIDTCSTRARTLEYLAAIAEITDAPVRTLVNTHHHGDHTHGNCLIPGATIVAHRRTREAMLAFGLGFDQLDLVWGEVDWGELELEPPFLTFEDRITVHVDDLECRVIHTGGPAHTTDDSYVWIPERKVLIAGDLIFNRGTPFVLMGSIRGLIDVLTSQIAPLAAETIIPGHGPVCGPEVIDEIVDYLHYVQQIADRGIRDGLSPLEAAQTHGPGPFAHLSDAERLVGNLHRAYSEHRGEPLGAPIDVPAAMLDMIVYNDGQPLRCLA